MAALGANVLPSIAPGDDAKNRNVECSVGSAWSGGKPPKLAKALGTEDIPADS